MRSEVRVCTCVYVVTDLRMKLLLCAGVTVGASLAILTLLGVAPVITMLYIGARGRPESPYVPMTSQHPPPTIAQGMHTLRRLLNTLIRAWHATH